MVNRGFLLLLVVMSLVGAYAWAGESAPVVLAAKWTTGQFSGEEAIEQAVLACTNAERAKLKLTPLTRQDALRTAARQHSLEMGEKKYLGHESPVAAWYKSWHRAYLSGYWGQRIGENVIMLRNDRLHTPEEIAHRMLEWWMSSPEHRANILKAQWTVLGVGVTKVGNAYYATQVFGAPLVELQSATVTPVTGEVTRLHLEGSLRRGNISVWVDNHLYQTVTPVRGKWSADVDCPRCEGEHTVMVGVNGVLAWMAQFNPDNPEKPVRAVEEDRKGVVKSYSASPPPNPGIRLTATARVPAGRPILLARDKDELATLTPDANGMVTITLLLPHRVKPYTISLAVGDEVEDLLFIDTTKPANEAFLGRPE